MVVQPLGVANGVSKAKAFPDPRGMAMANNPPVRTAFSIFEMTVLWSGDQGR
jgi:hypothetical protein